MFTAFLRFELATWRKQPLTYVFLAVTFGLTFLAMLWPNLQMGQDLRNLHVNAPFAILSRAGAMTMLCLLFITAIMASTATRDSGSGYAQVLYAAPLEKAGYLWGRFTGGVLVAVLALLGLVLAILLGTPLNEPARVGAFQLLPYVQAVGLFIVPNVVLAGAIIYCLTVLTRNTVYAFIAALGLMVGFLLVGLLTPNLDTPTSVLLLDPFGLRTLHSLTKYWTVAEKNTALPEFVGPLLTNRLVWLGIAGALMGLTHGVFSFTTATGKVKKQRLVEPVAPVRASTPTPRPRVQPRHDRNAALVQLLQQARLDLLGILKSVPFWILLGLGMLNLLSIAATASEREGGHFYPVTYTMLDLINGTYGLFVIAVLVYYGGALVWKEQDARLDGILDASPRPSWVPYTAKMLTLVFIAAFLTSMGVLVCVAAQALQGYTNFEWSLYGQAVFGIEFTRYVMVAVGTVFLHVLLRNKFLAYGLTVAIILLQAISGAALDWNNNLFRFADTPAFTYSDMNGFGPFAESIVWFKLYWTAFCVLLLALTAGLWVRGRAVGGAFSAVQLRQSFTPALRAVAAAGLLAWLGLGAWIYYNIDVRNDYTTEHEDQSLPAEYEKRYKRYEHAPQPRITAVNLQIDLTPEARAVQVRGQLTLTNRTGRPLDTLRLSYGSYLEDFRFTIPGARPVLNDERLHFRSFALQPALAPGDSLVLGYSAQYRARGFENKVSRPLINGNGTFLNNFELAPTIGYTRNMELESATDRAKFNLPERPRMAPQTDSAAYANTYISTDADRLRFEATLSTSPDQIAVAPGALLKEWQQNGRRYFHYRLAAPVLNFYSITSARYKVRRERQNGVDLEIYYHPGHPYNLDRMMRSMRTSLAYYGQQFGAYPQQQARIIEFPRYQKFAQAFPGTMPYSEGLGFIAQTSPDDHDVDRTYRVVAHEMAHQWWGHRVTGAAVQGATFLSESVSEYLSTLMLERRYGPARVLTMRRYALDYYLRGRASEKVRELPLLYNEDQPHIHYAKGSLALYSLRSYLGEKRLHGALGQFIRDYQGRPAPYPTSEDLYRYILRATPDSLQYFVADQLKRITLYDNQVREVAYQRLPDGRYQAIIQLEVHKRYADELGKETEAPLHDYLDLALYGADEKVLARQRLLVDNHRKVVKLIVSSVPAKAVIDPDNLLIDRRPEDNSHAAFALK
ncbi:ABC transporter permease/M1 family aminopeptidase [Hymenobacter chitinivorans]|uniref:Peptidase M1-like protein n=1 Tax=Hymenobacter chitinivorans DSM 11115 TaxID=1121954 RepID=A0A2M9BT77_9BACT|nr:M1 family aminopeptidase [Hymenobacter chitinivorans]PJJ61156.1 peptidase M1-like protein [Hymenobacter chitinivorans DSM 11115]